MKTTPTMDAAVHLEVLAPSLDAILPGLHWHENQGCRIFPVHDATGKRMSTRCVAILLDGDGGKVANADVRWDGEPFSSNGVNGIAVCFERLAEERGRSEFALTQYLNDQITEAIDKLKRFVAAVPR
jgi:hypothetical protein